MTIYRKRSKILGGVGCTDGLPCTFFIFRHFGQRFQSRSIGTTRLGQPISVVSKGCCFAKLKHDHSRDRLPSIKLPLPSTKGGRCETTREKRYIFHEKRWKLRGGREEKRSQLQISRKFHSRERREKRNKQK